MNLSSSNLRKAAEIQKQIERLQGELDSIIQAGKKASTTETIVAATAPVVARRARGKKVTGRSPAGKSRGRSTSPTGPLAPAVVQVLKSKDSPMSVSEILAGLFSNGYKFASSEPKKNLFARIYRLKGVKQTGRGKFIAG